MKLVTGEQMRMLEQKSVEAGISLDMLMENAGLAVAEEIRKLRGGSVAGCPILILVGPGNNGGDGLVAARHFYDWDADVSLYFYKRRTEGDKNFKLLEERGLSYTDADSDKGLVVLNDALSKSEIVIDALFGTGKLRPLQGTIKEMLEFVKRYRENSPQLTVVAVDLPSGLDADSGAVDPACLSADVTITLGYPKVGLFNFPGAERVGKLIVAPIGIKPKLADSITTELITAEWVKSVLPKRPLSANKGTFGKVMVAAGSINYIGAAYLACAAATQSRGRAGDPGHGPQPSAGPGGKVDRGDLCAVAGSRAGRHRRRGSHSFCGAAQGIRCAAHGLRPGAACLNAAVCQGIALLASLLSCLGAWSWMPMP